MSSFPDSTPSDDTITIPLTRGYETIVDAVDADLAEFRWQSLVVSKVQSVYAKRDLPREKGKHRGIYMHREILSRVLGRTLARNERVDHINGDGLDNRRCNLRLATGTQNNANSRLRRTNTTGYKGVTWSAKRKKYVAQIHFNGRGIFLGHYDTPGEAHEAYKEAAIRLFGEFARFE